MLRMGACRPADHDAVVALWSPAFPADPVPAERFDALPARLTGHSGVTRAQPFVISGKPVPQDV